VTGINASVDGSLVTLVPLVVNGNTAATTALNMGEGLFGWRCGNGPTDGTTLSSKYLPGSCRGS